MRKCIYLIPHIGNFTKKDGKSVIGPSTHIDIGIRQLNKYFEVIPYIIGERSNNANSGKNVLNQNRKNGPSNNKFVGFLRDCKALFKNNIHVLRTYRRIKQLDPDFIFERSEYLNFQGLICSRLLGIPHFYEANWVHYNGIRQFYSSYFNVVAKKMEELMYTFSTHVFFVGNQHLLLNLKKSNWSIIQNGVSEEVIKMYSEHENKCTNDIIRVCVLANLMKHHRMDVLLEALGRLKKASRIKIYFIGVNFDPIISQVPENIQFEYLGALSKDKLYDILSTMNVAIISGGPFYSSFMKLYDYAAVKLAVISPNLSNLTNIFSDEDILYFKDEDSNDLQQKIDFLIDNPEKICQYGNNIYKKVALQFTWESIFFGIRDIIVNKTEKNT